MPCFLCLCEISSGIADNIVGMIVSFRFKATSRTTSIFFAVTKLSELSYKTAFLIGVFQVLSLVPGTSRSGATIIGGLLLGVSRYVAAEFTFFLAIPVMFGASALKLLKFFLGGVGITAMEVALLLVGCIVAFVVSVIAIKFLMGYIKKNDFKVFGYYRIVLGILVLGYFAITALIA